MGGLQASFEKGFLNSNILKIIALICMTLDHIGYILYPENMLLRIIGRIAFPIFAYLIAEGCKYTKNKALYVLRLFICGLISQFVIALFIRDHAYNIMLTFTLSVCIIFIIQEAIKRKSKFLWITTGIIISILFFLEMILPVINTSFEINFDYGFFGITIPVGVYLVKNKYLKLVMLAAGLIGVIFTCELVVQPYCLLSLILLLFYNQKRGRMKLKYLFYVYYPLHLLILFLIRIF